VGLACSYLFILASTFLHPAATVAATPTAKSHHLLRGTPDFFDLGCPHRAYPATSEEQGSEELLYLSNHALIPTAVHHHRHSLLTAQAVDPPEHTSALIYPHNNHKHRIATITTMSAATSTRPPFHAVDTSSAGAVLAPAAPDDVESPSLSSSNALARFEFEPGRSKEGTKVLMVEWEDDDTTRSIDGDWEISWEGKRTVLPAREHADATTKDTNATDVPVNRLYFLLGAGVAVPTTVRLQKGNIIWRTNPLPAIFSPELGATARAAGKKGVLHTIWAKKRLQVLQKEIDAEARDNMEGVGFEMAVAEKEWIEANFGVLSKPSGIVMPAQQQESGTLNSPTSPRSPGGGRLMEKLKGLRIGTTTEALSPGGSAPKPAPEAVDTFNPLSPESSDVAVGSFGAFAALKGMPDQSTLAAKPAQPPTSTATNAPQLSQPQLRRVNPPDSFAAQQLQAGLGSLNALGAPGGGFSSFEEATFSRPPAPSHSSSAQDEDDLFALPMSPRSPEMTKSPFSFAASDVGRYLNEDVGRYMKEGKSGVA
jgi:hypothetical protein